MRISTRLQLAEITCVMVVVVCVGILLVSSGQMKRELAKNADAGQLINAVTSLRHLTLEYGLRHEERVQAQWHLRSASLGREIDVALAGAGPDEAILLAGLRRELASVDGLFGQLVANQKEQLLDASKHDLLAELESRLSGVIANKTHVMIADAMALAERGRTGALAAQQRANVALLISGGVIVLVVGLTIFVTVRSVTRPLQRLSEATAEVGAGRLDFSVDMHAQDEIGELARAFDRMTDQLRHTTVSRNELVQANAVLTAAEQRVQAQLERLNLLHQITRSIGERQDLRSIFQVVAGALEEQMPVDFACICLYDEDQRRLQLSCIGSRSARLAARSGLVEQGEVDLDGEGLANHLVYEEDIGVLAYPFTIKLARAGLSALVLAPLRAEQKVFGVLAVARCASASFSSGECEFLNQLSEHAGLAANQARLYGDLQRTYEDLRQTQQTVMQQERLRALGQMASGIAHDINNAISPVSLYTESLLEQEKGLSEHGRSCLQVIERAIDDVAATVARMREFYRQREAQSQLAPVDLGRLVRHVADLTRARWSDMPQQRGIVVTFNAELMPDLPPVMGVEGEIREALTNLVFNAVDAMPDGGRLTMRTGTTTVDGAAMAYVEVADSGVGMSEETRKRCMEPFFTTKGERGTGLGLAMVYGMVERHSAAIEIRSALEKGTAVRLAFLVQAGTPALPPPAVAALNTSLRVLVIDDDPMVLKTMRDILGNDGHDVAAADGGQAGIEAFRSAQEASDPFAVVITDLGMPFVDGRKVAATIKSLSPSTPVLMLTGWGQRMVVEGGLPVHVDQVLSKPPKLRELREALASVSQRAGAAVSG